MSDVNATQDELSPRYVRRAQVPCPQSCPFQGNLAFNGDQLSSLVDFHSAATCQSECQQNVACVGFSFYNERCVMFRTITSYLIVRKCISGLNSWSSVAVENGLAQRISHPNCMLRGTSYKGTILSGGVLHQTRDDITTAFECQWECQKQAGCWYFTKDPNFCYLMSDQGHVAKAMGSRSGPKFCGQEPPTPMTLPPTTMKMEPITKPKPVIVTPAQPQRRSSIPWRVKAAQYEGGSNWRELVKKFPWEW
eukprot:TCALIF_07771-PA protein Name:"Protein of unknown function" AED:0.08 eAED:0.08 QI:0/0.5/0.4/0.8/1/1/5/56/249